MRTFNATYVCTQPRVWSVHFSVSQSLLYKYILHTHDNRFCPSLRTFIVSIFYISLRVILRLFPCLLYFFSSSVRTFAPNSETVRRIQCWLISFWQSINLSGPVGAVPLWVRKAICFKSRIETRSPVAFFPEKFLLLSDNFDFRTSIIIIIIIIIVVVVVVVTLVQCSPSVHFTLTHSKTFKNQ